MKKLAIIGNGKSALEHASGELIDSCDEVLRMNSFEIEGFEACVGSKTTIYGLVPYYGGLAKVLESRTADSVKGVKQIWSSRPKDMAEEKFYLVPEKLNLDVPIIHTPDELWESLKNEYNKVSVRNSLRTNRGKLPPSGLVFINMALSIFKDWEIYAKGFDLSFGGYYWQYRPTPRRGKWVRVEDFMIQSLAKKGRIKLL